MTLVHDMGAHRGCGGSLTMSTCYAESFMCACQRAKYLGAFFYFGKPFTGKCNSLCSAGIAGV